MVQPHVALIVFLCSSTAHFIAAAVMALFARHQVKYLSIAWIMGIFATSLLLVSFVSERTVVGQPGILHPLMLLTVMSVSFLQSIYPLSIPMPAYLQWGRMVKYAMPAIIFIAVYLGAILLGSRPVILYTFDDFRQNLLSGDVLMRLGMLLTSFWYVVNILLIPHRQTHGESPRYLVGYSIVLGLSVIFYLYITVSFDAKLMLVYCVLFTVLNLYLCFRTLENTALELPKPVIKKVVSAPTDEDMRKSEEDFNEANRQRFQRVEYWMQKNMSAWTESTFTREDLCRGTGINRHLLLQSLRSQGYNNVHDYINSYRIDELKHRICTGQVSTLTECLDSGFGALKTVRSCFLKLEGDTLDNFIQKNTPQY